MNTEESNTAKALKLVDSGVSKAAAAKECGISRQAIDDGLKRRAAKEGGKPARCCSECNALLPADARSDATTCSLGCRVKRSRRLKKEKAAERSARIADEQRRFELMRALPAKA